MNHWKKSSVSQCLKHHLCVPKYACLKNIKTVMYKCQFPTLFIYFQAYTFVQFPMLSSELNELSTTLLIMAIRHFGPLTEPPTASHTCWHIPPNLIMVTDIQNISRFRWNIPRFAFSITGAVSVPIFGGPLDLWLRDLWSHYQSLISPNHI